MDTVEAIRWCFFIIPGAIASVIMVFYQLCKIYMLIKDIVITIKKKFRRAVVRYARRVERNQRLSGGKMY